MNARLHRGPDDGSPPVRIVHLGLGAFHRAHQAWYTARADDSASWGISAFTSHSTALPALLMEQGGLYTLVERGADADRFDVISSIVEATPGSDVDAFVRRICDPAVAVVTLTITEAGYRLTKEGRLDVDAFDVQDDIARLRRLVRGDTAGCTPVTALGRLTWALAERRRSEGPGLAVVSCDNLPDNGRVLGSAISALAAGASPALARWIEDHISFVGTSVDRITPRVTPSLAGDVERATGKIDRAPVAAETFSDWILSGEFPLGRPAWETAGARFVDDISSWQTRKLWMLNGAHTLLAALGSVRGHTTVAGAIDDPECLSAVEALWDEDLRHLPDVDGAAYRAALLARFRNPRIEHPLEQIAVGSLEKLRLRIVPVAIRELAAERGASGCATAIGGWIAWRMETEDAGDSASGLLAQIDARLAAHPSFRDTVLSVVRRCTKERTVDTDHGARS